MFGEALAQDCDLEMMKTIVKEIIDNNINSMDKTFVHCGCIWH
jgi:hypothetical protein